MMGFPGYKTQAWRRVRAAKLRAQPSCEWCGAQVSGMAVDHVLPVKGYPHLWARPTNLRVLCPSCHNKRSHRDGQRGRPVRPVYGCDENGLPIDVDHPWLSGEYDCGEE